MGEASVAGLVADMLSWRRAREPDPADARLALAVLERIAAGAAVSRDELVTLARAAAGGTAAEGDGDPAEAEERAERVAALAELDPSGAVVGIHGLSLEPTAYTLALAEGDRGTWCALDTLFLPPLLGRSARVDATCAVTGAPVSVGVTADGHVRDPAPATLTLTVPVPDPDAPPRTHGELRATFCAYSRYAAHPDAADALVRERGDLTAVDLKDGALIGRGIAEGLAARAG